MKSLISAIVLVSVCFFFGCTEKETQYIVTNPVDVKPGSIYGTAYYFSLLYPETSNPLSGAIVTIAGTTFTTISDSSGKWELTNIPVGTYNINLWKKGYDSATIYSFCFAANGDGCAGGCGLNQFSTVTFNNLTAVYFNHPPDSVMELITINWTKSTIDSNLFQYSLYLSKDSNVSYQNYTFDNEYRSTYYITKVGNSYLIFLDYRELDDTFKKGDKVYVIAYPGELNAYNLTTTDWKTGISRHLTVPSPSPVASFIMQK